MLNNFKKIFPIFKLNKYNTFIIDNFNLDTPLNFKNNNNFLSCNIFNNIVDLYTHDDNSGNQKWLVEKNTNDTYFIRSQSTNKYLGSNDGNNIILVDNFNEKILWKMLKIRNNIFRLSIVNNTNEVSNPNPDTNLDPNTSVVIESNPNTSVVIESNPNTSVVIESNFKSGDINGCIIFFGESFRLGGQCNRVIGSPKSYNEQINAANSHISFIKDLNSKKINIDIYLSSYETIFTKNLIKIYKNNLIGYDFYKNLIGQDNLIHNAINKILNIEKYDFLLIIRIDLFLKNKFIEIFNSKWDKIMWPTICFKPYHKIGNDPRVNDTMIFIPKKYYKYIQYIHWYNGDKGDGHYQWRDLINNSNLKYDDLDTMLNTFHDSDSAKDFNPIYYIINRPESTIHHNEGDLFDKMSF